MATQAPPAPEKKLAPIQPAPEPPADSIWTRYSAHGEAPFSGFGSFGLHVLFIGLLIILAKHFESKRKEEAKVLPVEVVAFTGGGKGHGRGIGDNVGDGSDREDGVGKGDGSVQEGPKEDGKLSLNPDKIKVFDPAFKDDPDAARAISKGNPNVTGLASVNESVRNKLRAGLNPGGKNGDGPGGVSGGNDGDGTGGVKGRKPNEREKRMLRWRIIFERAGPAVYLQQLASMGAILGVPLDLEGKHYRGIDLKKGRATMKEDPTGLNLIFWFNNDPYWANLVVKGELKMNVEATHFIVFFPPDMEQEFVKAETSYKGRKESEIDETIFRLERRADGKYMPKVDSQTAK